MNKRKRIQQKAQAPHTPIRDKDHPNENYWNSVANDVASGYETPKDEDDVHNIDEQPGDHKRGDVADRRESFH